MGLNIQLIHGDCLEKMRNIPDNSIDLVLTDVPYGTTQCKWDTVIPFDPMWEQLKRVTKDKSTISLFGSEPFSSMLRMSNIKMFKYDWIWNKNYATNHLNAKKQPMREVELISVFYKNQCIYHPQLEYNPTKNIKKYYGKPNGSNIYGKQNKPYVRETPQDMKYPKQIIKFNGVTGTGHSGHPSQKPVPLLEYLIKTYTNEGDTVLDFTMGSGSTGVACKNLNRKFIGIELDKNYFDIASNRINSHEPQLQLL